MKERKKRIRIKTDVMVNGRHEAEALDLSEDGMYVFTPHTFMAGFEVNLEFNLDEEHYDMRALVKHSAHGVGFGVNFVDMPERDASRLKKYVDSH